MSISDVRRRLRWTPILVSLVLGVVINVLVAWGCLSVRYETGASSIYIGWTFDPTDLWAEYRKPDSSEAPIGAGEIPFFGARHRWVYGRRGESMQEVSEHECGFPVRSLRVVESGEKNTAEAFGLIQSNGLAPFHGRHNHGFPVQPTFPGFILGALIYALPVWLLWDGRRYARRRIRLARGNCPNCAYPLTDRGACPECGFAAPRRTEQEDSR